MSLSPARTVAQKRSNRETPALHCPDGKMTSQSFFMSATVYPVDVRNAISGAQKDGKRTVLMRLKSDNAMKWHRALGPEGQHQGQASRLSLVPNQNRVPKQADQYELFRIS